MINYNPMLLMDFYKACHNMMLPKGMTRSVSYLTPRGSRIKAWDRCVWFGLQAFIQEYLIDGFNQNFFNDPNAVSEYKYYMDKFFGPCNYDISRIQALHNLGYLPIEVRALPEGSIVPVKVPVMSITNTHEDFAWLPQALESLISASIWEPVVCATVAYDYRQIVNEWYYRTCDDNIPRHSALSNFDFRGSDSVEAAIACGSAWLTSFTKTATVPALINVERNYTVEDSCYNYGSGSVSTEHAVMCSNFAIDGDEITLIRRLLTEIYPHTSFSAVLDSYDYWNIVDNILPQLRREIMEHNGTFFVRGDSGDCVEVVTQTVFHLWDIFGGSTNSKGYKVLDPHIRAIYGDSITPQRCREIYTILEQNGFAACNVALGAGSFSFQAMEEDGVFKPFTRDTFNFAIKATYCEIEGEAYPIFKAPKDADFKKSHRGCVKVYNDYTTEDGFTYEEVCNDMKDMMITVFTDGELVCKTDIEKVRRRLHRDFWRSEDE